MRRFYSAVVERNVRWADGGDIATEPYEAGWAGEAIAFVRVLSMEGEGRLELRVQISPDGMRWVDEGTSLEPIEAEGVSFTRVRHFGNWLRLTGTADGGAVFTVLVTWALKE